MEDNEQIKTALESRQAAITRYRILSCLMFGLGFVIIFVAVYAADMFHGTGYGVPYYVGALICGVPVIIFACVAGAVYYKGQDIGKASYITQLLVHRVKPVMLCYVIMAPFVLAFCLVGLILTGVYGFCAGDECSYASNTSMNLGLASFLFCLELISFLFTVVGMVTALYYARYFGLEFKLPHRKIPGTICVKPQHDEVQEAMRMYTLQNWRMKTDSVHMNIDFRKIRDYREQSNKSKELQNRPM